MNQAELTSKLWNDLEEQADGIPGGKRYAERLKRKYLEVEHIGDEVAHLNEESVYQKAVEMLSADVELMAQADRLHRAMERRQLKEQEFWLEVYDVTGLDGDDRLTFDPVTVTIRKRKRKPKQPSSSYKTALDRL